MEKLTKLEEKAKMFIDLKEEEKSLQERIDFLKISIEKDMQLLGETKVLVRLNEDEDIKVESAIRSSKKLDKEKIADDLSVEESVVKQDFLIKSVEDGKLTFEKYKGYHYIEQRNSLSIRKVKISKKKKGDKKQ